MEIPLQVTHVCAALESVWWSGRMWRVSSRGIRRVSVLQVVCEGETESLGLSASWVTHGDT